MPLESLAGLVGVRVLRIPRGGLSRGGLAGFEGRLVCDLGITRWSRSCAKDLSDRVMPFFFVCGDLLPDLPDLLACEDDRWSEADCCECDAL